MYRTGQSVQCPQTVTHPGSNQTSSLMIETSGVVGLKKAEQKVAIFQQTLLIRPEFRQITANYRQRKL